MFTVFYLKRRPAFKKVSVSMLSVRPLDEHLDLIHRFLQVRWGERSVNQAAALPLAPLAPVLRCEVKAFWIYAQVSLLHRSFMPIHNVL